MRPEFVRVAYDNKPYIVVTHDVGSLKRAYGPFTPGTEPNLDDCTDDIRMPSVQLRATLQDLLPISPALPSNENTLAGG